VDRRTASADSLTSLPRPRRSCGLPSLRKARRAGR